MCALELSASEHESKTPPLFEILFSVYRTSK